MNRLSWFLLGALTVFGFAPFHLFPLPILSLALLFSLWRRQSTPRAAAWQGFFWGLGFFLAGVSWVYVSMHDFGGMPAPIAAAATLLFCAYLALYPALVGWLFSRFKSGTPGRDALLLAGAWMLSEWLRGWLFTGFPWLALGYSQAPESPLAGFAAVLGVYGVGFIAALIAALLAALMPSPRNWRPAAVVILLLLCGQLLKLMDWTQPTGAPLTVSLLQGNIPQSLKWEPERLPQSLATYAALAREHPAQLTVLPETALPLFFDELPRDYVRQLTMRGAALAGVVVRTRDPVGGYTNAAVALDPALALAPQAYAKSHLVPFGEYVPPGFSWFLALMKIPMSDFSAGAKRQAPLAVAGQLVMPNICYEDLFGEEIIRALPAATLLVNLSNTAWFGHSLAQPQHLQISQMRALETGRYMLRATNTGMTAVVRPDGVVAAALPAFASDALTAEVRGYAGMTPYARWGNTLAVLIAILSFLPALRRRRS